MEIDYDAEMATLQAFKDFVSDVERLLGAVLLPAEMPFVFRWFRHGWSPKDVVAALTGQPRPRRGGNDYSHS